MRGGWKGPVLTDAQYVDRMKSRCTIEGDCWLWQGFRHYNGYGEMSYRGKQWRVHRLSFTLAKGPIPSGHDVCHTCDVRNCANPDHLWTGPRQLNNRDTTDKVRNKNQQKTHCPRMHSYAEHGFVKTVGYKGWRTCRICERARMRRSAGWPEHLCWSDIQVPHGYRLDKETGLIVSSKGFKRRTEQHRGSPNAD